MCKGIPLKVLSRFGKRVAVGMFAVRTDEHGSQEVNVLQCFSAGSTMSAQGYELFN